MLLRKTIGLCACSLQDGLPLEKTKRLFVWTDGSKDLALLGIVGLTREANLLLS